MDNGTYPDLYADSVSIASGAYGYALTFLLTDPALEGQGGSPRIVGRVRLSPELVKALAGALGEAGVVDDEAAPPSRPTEPAS